jgi:acyl-CoA dehydrogenase family member 9
MREVGEGLKATMEGLKRPSRLVPTLWRFGRDRLVRLARPPVIPVASATLRPSADSLARRVARFAWAVERALVKHREAILERQYVQERIADAAIALVTASCTLARLDRALASKTSTELERGSGSLYLRMANRRFDQALHELDHSDDPQTTAAAEAALRAFAGR